MVDNRKYNGLAITSFVLGIVSFFLGFIPVFGWIIITLAIIFGFISLSKIKKNNNLKGRGFAITGIILGFVSLIFVILIGIFFLSLLSQKTEGNSTIARDAMEILSLNNKCSSQPAMIPVSCNAATGEITINVKENFQGKEIFSTLLLTDNSQAYSSLEISFLREGETIIIPAPESRLSNSVKSAKIQYDLCGNAGCVGCTETVICK